MYVCRYLSYLSTNILKRGRICILQDPALPLIHFHTKRISIFKGVKYKYPVTIQKKYYKCQLIQENNYIIIITHNVSNLETSL